MARSRTKRPNRKRSYKKLTDIEIANRRRFHEEAWNQRVCQKCGKGGAHESHHVVEKKQLRQMFRADLFWDPRNCLRLCPMPCHSRHTIGSEKLHLSVLLDANYEFAFETLGGGAYYYLRRHYDGKDPRLEEYHRRWEEENGYEPST